MRLIFSLSGVFIVGVFVSMLTSCVATPIQPDVPPVDSQLISENFEFSPIENFELESSDATVTTILPEALPEVEEPVLLTADQLINQAKVLIDKSQSEQATTLLREALQFDSTNAVARLMLADLLMAMNQPSEAYVLLQAFTDVDSYHKRLSALQQLGSKYSLAMVAEEAVQVHPQQVEFRGIAIEALLDVNAAEKASELWQRLPVGEQNKPHFQWLLGRIHENNNQPSLAWQAFQQAKVSEPRASESLQELNARRIQLTGWQYFVSPPWIVYSEADGELLHAVEGTLATIAQMRNVSVSQAVQQLLLQQLPIEAEGLSSLMAGLQVESAPWIQFDYLECHLASTDLCIHAGPSAEYIGVIPDFYLAAVKVGVDTLLISVKGGERISAISALNLLGRQAWLVQGE